MSPSRYYNVILATLTPKRHKREREPTQRLPNITDLAPITRRKLLQPISKQRVRVRRASREVNFIIIIPKVVLKGEGVVLGFALLLCPRVFDIVPSLPPPCPILLALHIGSHPPLVQGDLLLESKNSECRALWLLVPDFEVEPLEMPLGVGVNSHVEIVRTGSILP